MKLRENQSSTHPLISRHEVVHHTEVTREIYDHPWDRHVRELKNNTPIPPNPPTKEAVKRARFVDKTFHWSRDISN